MAKPTLEIYSPIQGKGLGREYTAQKELVDESNYVELGLIVRYPEKAKLGEKSKPEKDSEVTVECTDATQNKILASTGNVNKIGKTEESIGEKVHYYPFHYEFRTVGKHTIMFTCGGESIATDFNVTEPEPA